MGSHSRLDLFVSLEREECSEGDTKRDIWRQYRDILDVEKTIMTLHSWLETHPDDGERSLVSQALRQVQQQRETIREQYADEVKQSYEQTVSDKAVNMKKLRSQFVDFGGMEPTEFDQLVAAFNQSVKAHKLDRIDATVAGRL